MAGRDKARWRTALLVSLLIHIALLAPLVLVAPSLRMAQRPSRATMVLGLVPEAGLGMAAHPVPPGRSAASQPTLRPASRQPPALSSAATTLPAPSQRSPPAQTASASADGGTPATAAAARNQDAVRRALHAALACASSNAQNLDAVGRAACGKRLSDAAAAIGDARVDTIPPEKRAYYDAVQKAYQDFRAFPTPDTTLTHLPGAQGMADQRLAAMPGHPPAVGCRMPFGGQPGAKPAGAPPHSLHFNLGPLTCFAAPPSSPLTPEVDLPPADSIPKN